MKSAEKEVFVALGSNLGDSYSILQQALERISSLLGLSQFEVSRFYLTTPVGRQDQRDYLNAVCRFKTACSAKRLLTQLQQIERFLGKVPKPKDAARIIDLDILFFGMERYCDEELEIPHPRWAERLFVLMPLTDLTSHIEILTKEDKKSSIDLQQLLKTFPNIHQEKVIPYHLCNVKHKA